MIYFKVLDGRESCHGGDSMWKLRQWRARVCMVRSQRRSGEGERSQE